MQFAVSVGTSRELDLGPYDGGRLEISACKDSLRLEAKSRSLPLRGQASTAAALPSPPRVRRHNRNAARGVTNKSFAAFVINLQQVYHVNED